VNHTRSQCVNQMGKTHSKLLASRHGRGTAWARHAMCESALNVSLRRGTGLVLLPAGIWDCRMIDYITGLFCNKCFFFVT
jgi:hypothetical protein